MNAKRNALADAIIAAALAYSREAMELAEFLRLGEGEAPEWANRGGPARTLPPALPGHHGLAEAKRITLDETGVVTPEQYKLALKALGLNAERAASVLGVERGTSYRYQRVGPPLTVVKLLNAYLRHGLPPNEGADHGSQMPGNTRRGDVHSSDLHPPDRRE